MDDENDNEYKLKINTDYASRYDKWRAKEEYEKLKAKYGDVRLDTADGDDSGSSSSEEAEQKMTPHIERDFLRTLAALKSKDPKIYDPTVNFFEQDSSSDTSDNEGEVKKDNTKPMYLKDYEREVISKREGKFSDDDSDIDTETVPKPVNYYEEQEAIRQSFKNVMSADDDDADNLLSVRVKSKAEQQREEEEYLEWLKGQKDSLNGDQKLAGELQPLRSYWNNPSLDEGEQFLRDYILNKRYVDDEDEEEQIPSYDEIVRELEEEEEQLEKEEQFEREFNFRYEEPDATVIKSYPRVIPESLRNKDTRRIEKRKQIKERKSMMEEKKREELKRLKNLKKREIMEKIEKLKEITGVDSIGFSEHDIDGDFNAEEYDRLMKKVFNEEYYGEKDDQKPVFSDTESEEENWDDWAGRETHEQANDANDKQLAVSTELHCDDPDFIMDCDYDPSQKRSRKVDRDKISDKRKRKKSRFAQLVEKPKPCFNENFKSFSDYLDQYYNLDYEDIVADIPVRFKYRKVMPNDFGLTVDEVLSVPDQELNQWASVKKMSQYRTDEEEQRDIYKYKKKGRNRKNKLNVLTSLQQPDHSSVKAATTKIHKKGANDSVVMTQKAKEHQQNDSTNGHMTTSELNYQSADLLSKISNKKLPKDLPNGDEDCLRKSKKRKLSDDQANLDVVCTPVVTKKVKHNKAVVSSTSDNNSVNVEGIGDCTETSTAEHVVSDSSLKKKKKKKGKKKHDNFVDSTVTSEGSKKSGKKKHKKVPQISDDRLKAYGINPKKFKYVHLHNLQSELN